MKVKVEIENITPSRAKDLLSCLMDGQRPVRNSWVDSLAAEIKLGKFKLSPDALLIVKGCLANGQHRLRALIQAERACQFLVFYSEDEELYSVLDCGKGRSVADVAHQSGLENCTAIAAAGRLILAYKVGVVNRGSFAVGSDNPAKRALLTRSKLVEFLEQNEAELSECIRLITPLYEKNRLISRSNAASFLYLARQKKENQEKAFEFLTKVYKGTDDECSAADLHSRLLSNFKSGTTKLRPSYIFGLIIKAYKSYLQGTRVGCLKISEGESFPVMP